MAITFGDVPRLICAILLPPLGVFFQVGCTRDLAINILLTILGYIPGIIHAVYILIRE
uniref:AlNc14C23G2360 protein n=1 Tax=Albugo laibachii Nc14 TaxID=890382 RepID=F0W661_9STRA|nr:AlNc14C23G2360 [Albugo laibachii Nc14]|eukprot:CCA16603.1 AlNc14C23G2360 [Albugo laibachii Nc14]